MLRTPAGEAWLWRQVDGPDPSRPLVLFIEGAFAIARPRSFELETHLPEASVLNAHLPGNHCPVTPRHSVHAYAALYDAALDEIARPLIVVGSSVGALVALGLRSPWVRGLVLAEPPLLMADLWPLLADYRARLAAAPDRPEVTEFIGEVFGIFADRVEPRDYRPLARALTVPAWALYGGEPLQPPRPLERLPSLVDEPERAFLRGLPGVKTMVVPGVGHNVAGPGALAIVQCVRELLERAAP